MQVILDNHPYMLFSSWSTMLFKPQLCFPCFFESTLSLSKLTGSSRLILAWQLLPLVLTLESALFIFLFISEVPSHWPWFSTIQFHLNWQHCIQIMIMSRSWLMPYSIRTALRPDDVLIFWEIKYLNLFAPYS
jgi:hypothetical protein